MASTDKNLAQEFYSDFQAARTDLSGRLDAIKSSRPASPGAVSVLSQDVAKLRKKVTDAISFLPAYDQRQYENFLQSVEQSLGQLQAADAKPKFSFKRKPNAASANPPPAIQDASDQVKRSPTEEPIGSNHLSLSGHSREYLNWSALPSVSARAADLAISDLNHCVVNLLPDGSSNSQSAISALHIRNLTDTVIILPSIEGSALVHNLTNCIIVLGSHQYRMHASSNVDVYLTIQSNPIIEHCSCITFASYPPSLLSPSGEEVPSFNDSKNLSVQDFSHIRPTPSPNWSALPAERHLPTEDWISLTRNGPDVAVAMLAKVLPGSSQPSLA